MMQNSLFSDVRTATGSAEFSNDEPGGTRTMGTSRHGVKKPSLQQAIPNKVFRGSHRSIDSGLVTINKSVFRSRIDRRKQIAVSHKQPRKKQKAWIRRLKNCRRKLPNSRNHRRQCDQRLREGARRSHADAEIATALDAIVCRDSGGIHDRHDRGCGWR
ncbi:hypothetical protein SS37A_37880 (plasmid) [Methylocystis iwaonis]|uniref:Uncharacterized protein n=1 Tax=Methylocystis iwaonis TaxID=2885079 RepID=A0ABM8EE05_9HYPH|nr:hypothetical protein SS37A_37880 [Methylocystis iwaonis]